MLGTATGAVGSATAVAGVVPAPDDDDDQDDDDADEGDDDHGTCLSCNFSWDRTGPLIFFCFPDPDDDLDV